MSYIDRLLVGQVVQDFGPVQEKNWLIGKRTYSVMLVRKSGRLRFVLKSSIVTLIGLSVTYFTLELEEAYQLRDRINQIEALVSSQAMNTPAIVE
jgi:hypothetical protein